MAMTLHRAGAVWVNEDAEAYVWDEKDQLFYRATTGEVYEIVERPREDVVVVKADVLRQRRPEDGS